MELELLLKKLDEVLEGERRIKIGGALLTLGVALLAASMSFDVHSATVAKPEQSAGKSSFQKLWFDQEGVLYGSNHPDGTLSVERLTGGTGESSWAFSVPANLPRDAWAVTRSPGHDPWAAYLEDHQIHLLRADRLERTIDLDGFAEPILVTVLPGDLLGVVFRDGNTAWWDPVSVMYRNQQRLAVQQVGQAASREGYLAVEDVVSHQISMVRFLPDEGWVPNQRIPSPDRPFRLLVPSAGTVGTLQGTVLQINGETVDAPGQVTSVAMRGGEVLVAGDFGSVVALDPDGALRLEGASGDTLAVKGDRLAVSGPQGTEIYQIQIEGHRSLLAGAIQLCGFLTAFAGAILMLAPVLIMSLLAAALRGVEERESGEDVLVKIPAKLPEPPPEMIKAARSGHSILWAGSGLSAQSGVMTRSRSIEGLIQTADVENWVEHPTAEKLQQMVDQHRTELALDQLLTLAPETRTLALSQVKSSIASFRTASPTHNLLRRIPFAAAITTNYDELLERSGFPWSTAVFNLRTLESADLEHGFLLKLYGGLNDARVALAHKDLKPLVKRSGFAAMAMEIVATRPIIFIGASLEGLLADLELLEVPKFAGRHHFAIAGSSNPQWREHVARLEEEYGITAIVCQEAKIREELPAFLLRLETRLRDVPEPEAEPEGVRA